MLTDVELLRQLCAEENDKELYDEFVRRFYQEVKAQCERHCRARKLDAHIGEEVAHDTFEKVRRHKTFREEEMNGPDPRKAILVYLTRISVNLFNDRYRKEKKQQEVFNHSNYFDDLRGATGADDPETLQQIKEKTLEIIKKLSPKEQRIILADYEYKKHHKYLPDDVTERLAEELGIRKDTVRKIRQRAIEKIKTAIHEFDKK